jgi:hypothetical protein
MHGGDCAIAQASAVCNLYRWHYCFNLGALVAAYSAGRLPNDVSLSWRSCSVTQRRAKWVPAQAVASRVARFMIIVATSSRTFISHRGEVKVFSREKVFKSSARADRCLWQTPPAVNSSACEWNADVNPEFKECQKVSFSGESPHEFSRNS